MNLRARTRKPAKWPDKSALLASSHHRVDRTFMGTRVGAALQKTGRPGFNICMCWDTLESNPAAETVMFHAPPSPCCASACGQHPTLPGQVQKQWEGFFFEKKVVKRCTEYRHQKKTTPFLKNSDDGTILSDGGTTIFFISDDGCMNNCIF